MSFPRLTVGEVSTRVWIPLLSCICHQIRVTPFSWSLLVFRVSP